MRNFRWLLSLGLALRALAADLPPLNSPATTDWFPGKLVWGDLFTSDQTAAEKFYTGLFGWSSTTIERDTRRGTHAYIILSNDDRPIAGIALGPQQLKDEGRGHWVLYASVPDVDRAVSAATDGGGRVVFPLKTLPERGTQAIVLDREGAMIGLLHSSTGDPGEYRPDPGDWSWAELFARDPAAAAQFYQHVAGYDGAPDGRTDRPGGFLLSSGGYARASVVPLPDRPQAKPAWLGFVRVAGLADSIRRAESLGGKVLVSPRAAGDVTIAIVRDPVGAAIGLVELNEANPPSHVPDIANPR